MAVEIKELVIRAVVAPPDGDPRRKVSRREKRSGQEALIDAAVKEVLRLLRVSKER